MQRPNEFELDYSHPLAKGLVFAGLGAYAGGDYVHDSSPQKNHGEYYYNHEPTRTPSDWTHQLGRLCMRFNNTITNLYNQVRLFESGANVTTGLTLAAWVNAKDWTNPNNAPIIDKFFKDSSRAYFLWAEDGTTWPNAAIRVGISASNGLSLNIDETFDLSGVSTNEWHHIAITWSKLQQYVFVFVNGNHIDTSTSTKTTDVSHNTMKLQIGGGYNAQNSIFDDVFQGMIGDPMVFDRALSSAEIRQLADPSNVMLSGLIRERGDPQNIYNLEGVR